MVIYSEEQVDSVDKSSLRGNIRSMGGGEPLAKQTSGLLLKIGPVIRHQLRAVRNEAFDQGWRASPGLVLKL